MALQRSHQRVQVLAAQTPQALGIQHPHAAGRRGGDASLVTSTGGSRGNCLRDGREATRAQPGHVSDVVNRHGEAAVGLVRAIRGHGVVVANPRQRGGQVGERRDGRELWELPQ